MDTKSSNWRGAKNHLLLVVLALILLQHLLISVTSVVIEDTYKVHIVYMGEKTHEDPALTIKSHYTMLSTLLGSTEAAKRSLVYSYKHGFSGFAARLTESQAKQIAVFPGVVKVMPNRVHKLHTTRSWDFLGLKSQSPTLLTGSNLGQGIIIGVIDSGVWPESESFNDKGVPPIPSHWKGKCQGGELFDSSKCNRKLIGARWYIKALLEEHGIPLNNTKGKEYLSPRDFNGHGTHTASTAGGNFVDKASQRGLATGVARGGAPLAHLAIYKAAGLDEGGYSTADVMKAFDKAIDDGVDLLSISLGPDIPAETYVDNDDAIAIGSFHAVANGITVVAAGGNSGPNSLTIVNAAPWIITVSATTIDRTFPTAITLGNNHTFLGQSIDTVKSSPGMADLIQFENGEACKLGVSDARLVAGKIVLCFLTDSSTGAQEIELLAEEAEAAVVGFIFSQYPDDGLAPCSTKPCVKVDYGVGTQIVSYMSLAKSPVAKLSNPKTVTGKFVAPRVATFSSRGPNTISPTVLKPDIAAPGVDILAAYGDTYKLDSGTSMACPHVSGIVALIKSVHKDWSPAAIRSALVTTASQTATDGSVIYADGSSRKPADPFDIGGGQVNPNKAMNPGLIYDISKEDYIHFLCSMGYGSAAISNATKTKISCVKDTHLGLNLNLPSISIPNLRGKAVVTRKVMNVGHSNSVYKAIVKAPYGIKMTLEPQVLRFNSTKQVLPFTVTFYSTPKMHQDYKFGSLTWTDGMHIVRSPIAVRAIVFDSYADV